MPATDIILDKPLVMIMPQVSSIGVESSGGNILSGIIVNIFNTSDKYAIDDIVGYLSDNSKNIVYESVNYTIIDEANILFKEILPP